MIQYMINDYQNRISLLNEYSHCLERENQAKTIQISILHQQLSKYQSQNAHLRCFFDQMKHRLQAKQQKRNISLSLQTSTQFESSNSKSLVETGCQTRDEQQQSTLDQISKILQLTQTLREKDDIIVNYHRQCEQMFDAIQKLQSTNKQLQNMHSSDKNLIKRLQERLRRQQQKRVTAQQRLQDASYNIYNVNTQIQSYQMKISEKQREIQNLVLKQNRFIEKIRGLQKQKNEYYHEIKRMSRISFGSTNNLQKSSVKKTGKVTDQRFKDIQQNLKKLQSQNQALQSNLSIRRRC